MRAHTRWALVVAGLAALVLLPLLVSLRPLHAKNETAEEVLAQVRGSSSIAYSGLIQARGELSLPNLPSTGGLAGLVSGTTRLRVWRSSATHLRVDQLSQDGEDDTITNGADVITWDSTHDLVTDTTGTQPLRVPDAGDLLPPALAKRLTPAGLQVRIQRLPAMRIAGRTALGLRLTPTTATTTVGHVDIDVDQDSGLPVRVAVTARGHSSPSFSATFLELHIGQPASSTLAFSAPEHTVIRFSAAPDFVADANRYAPFQLPATLAGLPRTQRVSTLTGTGGAATYGSGYTLLALLPMQQSTARQVIKALQPPVGIIVQTAQPTATAVEEQIPLANVLAVQSGFRAYLLSGTVSPAVLTAAANQLISNPPPFRGFRGRGGRPRR